MSRAAENWGDDSADSSNSVHPEIDALHSRARRAEKLVDDQALLLDMLAELLASNTLERALDALAAALKEKFDCERVAIALQVDEKLKIYTVSQQGVLEASSSEARLLVDAMDEACTQECVLCWPDSSDNSEILAAHRTLAGRRLTASYCSVPLYCNEKLVGAFLLERSDQQGFPVTALENLSAGLAPMLTLHRKADRSWFTVLKLSLREKYERYLGRKRPGMRLLCVLASIALLCSLFITTQWKIVAPAELLSNERRVISSPIDGFIAEIEVEPTDRVTEGQLLARLDRREIELEAATLDSEVVVAEAAFRAAMADQDGESTGIARARLAQARAQRAGLEQQLNRTDLTSPIDGLVIASDVTRANGTAVSRGETLFEIAPNTGFEVHVLVSEADVYDVHIGQTGLISLRATPGERLPIEVLSIHPVAEAKDGNNRFRVKAKLIEPDSRLRPGQSGVVRLNGGEASLLGAMTRRLNRRLSELWWRWIG